MAQDSLASHEVDEGFEESFARRPRKFQAQHADLEITPLIDITFLLLIFFLVCSHPDAKSAVDLPPARYGEGVSARTATIITVAAAENQSHAEVFLSDGKTGRSLPRDPQTRADQIRDYVDAGLQEGQDEVLIKAERNVSHREVSEVATAAAAIEGIRLYMAVYEAE